MRRRALWKFNKRETRDVASGARQARNEALTYWVVDYRKYNWDRGDAPHTDGLSPAGSLSP
jgi:hypothetical protein